LYGTHKIIQQGLHALSCMEHRGACGGDGKSGDGAGIMTQIPWKIIYKLYINRYMSTTWCWDGIFTAKYGTSFGDTTIN
jgi:glutamate synthase domain-containing protein 1